MQGFPSLVILLALSTHLADSLVISQIKRGAHKQQAEEKVLSNATVAEIVAASLQNAREAEHKTEINEVMVRPNAGKGPDTVKFGVRTMNFYGASLKEHSWSVDMVLICRWTDSRIVRLIPEGQDKMSMAWKQALELIWMPGIEVINRDIEKYEIVSASVTLHRSGEVHRVERAHAHVMKKFELEEYPFDSQDLNISIASSKYMSDDVVLEPDDGVSGVEENDWGIFVKKSWGVRSSMIRYGEVEQSRGTLSIRVSRTLTKYAQDHLVPSFMCLAISWSVFSFPFTNPFITARLALSILALLTFTNLMVKSGKELPPAAPFNWNDLFNEQVQALMFVTIVLNIASEVMHHSFHKEELARAMNHEFKVLIPLLSTLNVAIILGSAEFQCLTLEQVTLVTPALVAIAIVLYCAYWVYKLYELAKNALKDEGQGESNKDDADAKATQQGDGDGGEDGDAGDAGDAGC